MSNLRETRDQPFDPLPDAVAPPVKRLECFVTSVGLVIVWLGFLAMVWGNVG